MSRREPIGNKIISSGNGITIIECPVCSKSFVRNPSSIYKCISYHDTKYERCIHFCGYTCWNKFKASLPEKRTYYRPAKNYNTGSGKKRKKKDNLSATA